MKLKERLRIAWQVLTKGTCDELKRAEQEKEKAVMVAETFEEFLRESDVECPAVLTSADGVHSIRLNEIQLNIIHPTERPFYASARPQKQWLYTLHNIDRKFAFDMAARNADMLGYFQQQAVKEVAKAFNFENHWGESIFCVIDVAAGLVSFGGNWTAIEFDHL